MNRDLQLTGCHMGLFATADLVRAKSAVAQSPVWQSVSCKSRFMPLTGGAPGMAGSAASCAAASCEPRRRTGVAVLLRGRRGSKSRAC